MGDYYSRTIDCIAYVKAKVQGKDGASKIRLNKRQCECVARELSDVSKTLRDRGAANLQQRCQRTVLIHLHATVKRAQKLVDMSCCEDSSWLAAALILGDAREEVMAILSNLYMWAFVLDMNGSGSEASASHQIGGKCYQRLSDMQSVIQDAARQDQESLEEMLNSPREDDQHDDDDFRRLYLKSRLNHTEQDLESVAKLKEYTYARDLGSGSSGMVLAVKWLGHDLALKILKVIDRTEATALGQVQHPNIVRFFHYYEDMNEDCDLRSCILMELMPKDLQKHIGNVLRKQSVKSKKGVAGGMPFSLPVAIDTMLQVAQAMRELHEKKLTHRDLKTLNILVRPVSAEYLELHSQGYLEVKLADFGSAKAYANTSQSRDLTRNTGTTEYGAPEIFEKEEILRERNFPPKADVWSFGIVSSEILTGNPPFLNEQKRRSTLHTKIRTGLRPRLPEDCPEYLKFCIKSCWELEPQRRPSFSDLCRMLRHAKLLSLGLMDVESSKFSFAYQISAGVMKSPSIRSLHLQEEPKVPRCSFKLLGWRNSRRVGSGSARSRQSLLSDADSDESLVRLRSTPNASGEISYKYDMLLDIDIDTELSTSSV